MTPTRLPPLVAGDRLDRPTFHARYEAMPPDTRAELVGGTVRFPPPRVTATEGQVRAELMLWLGSYERSTPGTAAVGRVTKFLGPNSEVEPACSLRIELGGQTQVTADDYLNGCPELVGEVALAPGTFELRDKLADYDRYGAREYVVVLVRTGAARWFRRGADGRLAEVPPDGDGLYRSMSFPGLWLDPAALLRGDGRRVLDVVSLGLATPEHGAFVAELTGRTA